MTGAEWELKINFRNWVQLMHSSFTLSCSVQLKFVKCVLKNTIAEGIFRHYFNIDFIIIIIIIIFFHFDRSMESKVLLCLTL